MNAPPFTPARLVVIGAGPAGYPAAFHAADLGLRVTLVDLEEHPGGVCLHRGCIPSKALLHVARWLAEAEELRDCGVETAPPRLDLNRLREWKESVVRRLTGGLGQLRRARGVETIRGRARFAGPDTIIIETAEGRRTLDWDAALVATGSRPATLPGWPQSPRVMDSTGALDLPDVPRRMLVVGGGYIGLELGTVYAALGSRVCVVEATPGLLPGADRDLVAPLAKRLAARFEAIWLDTRVVEAREQGEAIRVTLQHAAETRDETFDRVLISVGRRPNRENLGLAEAGIETDARGCIRVDERRRTSHPRVWAAGDIAGEPMLAHKATAEARVAVEAMAGRTTVWDARAIPAVVYTDPEIAWAGLTETAAAREGQPVRVVRFPWTASGRALTLERTEGLTKLVLDPDSGRVLGVGIVGVGAGDMIAEGALAIEIGATAEDLALTIHPHPTLSETVMEAAELASGRAIHVLPRA